MHLRKRSLDRLRACGDLTVFKPKCNSDSSSRSRRRSSRACDGFFVVTPTPTGQRVRLTTATTTAAAATTWKSTYIWPTLESNPSACLRWLSWFRPTRVSAAADAAARGAPTPCPKTGRAGQLSQFSLTLLRITSQSQSRSRSRTMPAAQKKKQAKKESTSSGLTQKHANASLSLCPCPCSTYD